MKKYRHCFFIIEVSNKLATILQIIIHSTFFDLLDCYSLQTILFRDIGRKFGVTYEIDEEDKIIVDFTTVSDDINAVQHHKVGGHD